MKRAFVTLLEKHIGVIAFLAIVLFLGGYLVFSWYNPEPMTPDEYKGTGEHYDNRWGQ